MKLIAVTESAAEFLALSATSLVSPFIDVARTRNAKQQPSLGQNVYRTTKDKAGCRFAIIDTDQLSKFSAGTDPAEVFARILRVIRATNKFPIRLPTSWSEYHAKSLIAFFAVSRGSDSARWIVDVDQAQMALKFVRLTTSGESVNLEKYVAPTFPNMRGEVDAEVSGKVSASALVSDGFVDRVDLDTIGAAAVSRSRSYEDWLPYLTAKQLEVLSLPPLTPLRIVGPAGSGKTLTICLRALRECRLAAESGRQVRVLVATHSWAMAERIDEILTGLNAGAIESAITVYPLLQILNDVLGGSILRDLRTLGADSAEGRALQISLLGDALDTLRAGDRALLSLQDLSSLIVSALDGDADDRRELLENLYEEVNGVLLAEGLQPGNRSKEEDYLSRVRDDDLPPFDSRGDRGLVLFVYKEFLYKLRQRQLITTDQLVSDATRILETFSWAVKRESEGFDLIVIDELQLFDAQERFAVALLAASQDSVVFLTAEDPSQGIFSSISPAWRTDVPGRTARTAVDLSTPHRFTPGVLLFVYSLYLAFPLNAQAMPISNVTAQSISEGRPALYRCADRRRCIDKVLQLVKDVPNSGQDSRLAVITIGEGSADICSHLRTNGVASVVEIEGLDDIEMLSYQRRATVVGEWRFLGGTQFSHVIVVALTGFRIASSFAKIRDLTALYVASSRASQWLRLVHAGDTHPELERAIEKEMLELKS